MTHFKTFCKHFADEIGGQYQEYDEHQSIVIIPMEDGRFQAVTGHLSTHPTTEGELITIKSKVCSINADIPYEDLLKPDERYPFAKFAIEGEHVKVEWTAYLAHLAEDEIKEMMIEVATYADRWEEKITGKDVH